MSSLPSGAARHEASQAAPGASWPEPGHFRGPADSESLGPGYTHPDESSGSLASVPHYERGPVLIKQTRLMKSEEQGL